MSDINDSKIKNLVKKLYTNKNAVDKNLKVDSRVLPIFGFIFALVNLFVFYKLDMTAIGIVVFLVIELIVGFFVDILYGFSELIRYSSKLVEMKKKEISLAETKQEAVSKTTSEQ